MSIQAVGWVLSHSTARMGDRLVLLAIANYAKFECPICRALEGDDYETPKEEGAHCTRCGSPGVWEAWPAVKRIAEEANLAPRVVQLSLARLEEAELLERVINGAPDARKRGGRRSNLYRIIVTTSLGRGARDIHPTPPRGVHATYTPETDGVSGNDTPGVNAPDTEGCSSATPKPLVEPSVEPPPSREPREVAPSPATDGGVNDDQRSHPGPATTGDERRARIFAACRLIAERTINPNRPGIDNPAAYLDGAAGKLAAKHATEGHRLLTEHPDLPTVALADLLEPPPARAPSPAEMTARQREREQATRQRLRDIAAQPADPKLNAEHLARIRASLGRPHQETTDA